MATVTYEVTMDQRDAATFLEVLSNAEEEGELTHPFEVHRVSTCDDEEG